MTRDTISDSTLSLFPSGEDTQLRDANGDDTPAPEPVSAEIPLLDALLEITPDAMIVVRDGRIASANGIALRMFGYDASEIIGLRLESLLPERFRESHAELTETYLRDPQTRPMRSRGQLQALRRDGREFPVEVGLGSVGSGPDRVTIASIRDIGVRLATERRLEDEIHQREELTRDREDLLRKATYLETLHSFALSLLKSSTLDEILWDVARNAVAKLGFVDCVVYMLDEQRGVLVQKAAYGPKNPIADEIYNPITIPVGKGIVGSVAATGRAELVHDTRLDPRYIQDDELRRSELAVPIVRQGVVIGVVDSEHPDPGFYSEDDLQILTTIASMASTKIGRAMLLQELQETVERLTAAEGRLERAVEDLRLAKDEAETASQDKSTFLAVMSHEIRTPMNAILGMTDLVLDTTLNRDQRGLLQTVQINAEALLTIINGILDFSQLEAGGLQLSPVDFSVVDVVEGVVEVLAARAADKDIEITAVLAPTLPPVVWGDAGRFRQILVNLVGNAVKFTSAGGKVVVRAEAVSTGSARIRIQVADTGIGISTEDLGRIFRPFYQADQSLARSFEGTGLGLGITNSLLTLMDGTITVSSEVGVGTTIIAEVPFEPSDHVFPSRRDSDRSFDDFSVRLAISDANLHEATIASLQALDIEIMADDLSEGAEPKPHRFLIADGGTRADSYRGSVFTGTSLDPSETVLLLCPHGSRPKTGSTTPHVHVISKPLTRRKLATSLIDESVPRTVTPATSRLSSPSRRRANPRILVVEDSRDNQRYVLRILEDASFCADLAVDGEEGITMAAEGSYDLIISDVEMPNVDGLEMTRRIREAEVLGGRGRTPIIALTAHTGESFRERCFDAGMDAHLPKPFRGPDLTALIESFLGRLKRVLVVDDDRASRQLVVRFLEQEPIRVEGCETIEQGRLSLKGEVDLVILDRNLPDGDGLDFAREIGATPGGPPVIVVTGHVGVEHRRATEEAGARYLPKPLRRQSLLAAVRDALSTGESLQAHAPGADAEVVEVAPDIEDLVEGFLDDWRRHVAEMDELVEKGDFTEIYRLGHNLKGSGAAYGFPKLSEIGEAIETDAEKNQASGIREGLAQLTTYLSTVEWRAR